MSFRSGKSRLRIDKDGDVGQPRAKVPVSLGKVGGTRRCQQRLLESDRNWQESAESISNALLPAGGAADFKGSALPADPLKEYGVWYTMTFDRFGRVSGVWQ